MQIDRTRYQTAAFREELAEAGSVAGKNVTIEFRFAEQRLERVPALVMPSIQPSSRSLSKALLALALFDPGVVTAQEMKLIKVNARCFSASTISSRSPVSARESFA